MLSRMTPRLLTWGEEETDVLSIEMEKSFIFREGGFGAKKEDFSFITVE